MGKYKKILLGLALSLSLVFLCEQISLADEESPENPTEISESQGETGEEKDKLIITEEPVQSSKPPSESVDESRSGADKASGDKGQEVKESLKDNPTQATNKEENKEEKAKNQPPAKEVKAPAKENKGKAKLKPKAEIKEASKLDKKPETSEKPKTEVNSAKGQNVEALEKDPSMKTEGESRPRTDQEESYIERSNQDTATNTYLEDQKNETLALEVGPNDNKEKSEEINLKTRAELKDEGAGADRIYIHLIGVFALALMAVILLKVIKTKKKEP